jgi:hypothetical protein
MLTSHSPSVRPGHSGGRKNTVHSWNRTVNAEAATLSRLWLICGYFSAQLDLPGLLPSIRLVRLERRWHAPEAVAGEQRWPSGHSRLRIAAGAFGFLTLIQSAERPDR